MGVLKRDAREIRMTETTEKPARVQWLDIAKGIAIVLMVIGHAEGIPGTVRGIIFSFHMPLFFLVSGYLIKDLDVKENLKRSCRSLLKPYVIVCLIEAVLSMYSAGNLEDAGKALFSGLDDMVLGLSGVSGMLNEHGSVWLVWFVICLFFARNLYILIRSLLRDRPQVFLYLVILILFGAGYLIGTRYAFLPWSLDVALVSVIFIAVGEVLRTTEVIERKNPFVLTGALLIWAAFLFTRTYIELATRRYPFVIGGVIEAIAGSIFILFLSKILEERSHIITGILSWYGRHSILILAAHCIEMRFFSAAALVPETLGTNVRWIVISVIRLIFASLSALIISLAHSTFIRWETRHFPANADPDKENSRIPWADVAKGISIIAVIAGHLNVGFINQLVFLWHLPVFFLLAGYFLKKKKDTVVIKEKARRLLVPYYATCAAITVIAALRCLIKNKDVLQEVIPWVGATLYAAGDSWTEPFVIKGIGAIWFLWALFFACVITNHFLGKRFALLFIGIIAFLGWGSMEWTGVWLPLSIQAGMLSSLYLIIGYKAKEKNVTPPGIPVPVILLSGIISALGIQHFKGFWLVHNYMGNGWIDFPVSVLVSLMIIVFSDRICKGSIAIQEMLVFFGKNSLFILCLHIIDLNVLSISHAVQKVFTHLSLSVSEILTITVVFAARIVYVVIGTLIIKKLTDYIKNTRQPGASQI